MLKLRRLGAVPSVAGLRRLHVWLGIIAAVEGVAAFVIGSGYRVPISMAYLNVDSLQSTTTASLVLAPASHYLFDLNLLILTGAAALIAAAYFLSLATWYRPQYETDLRQSRNPLRAVALGLCLGLLVAVSGALLGVYDIVILGGIVLLSVVLNLLLWFTEQLAGRGRPHPATWPVHILAEALGLIIWLTVGGYALADAAYGSGGVPVRFYALAATTFIATLLFGLSHYLQLKRARGWSQYRTVDRRYSLLLFVVVSVLCWQIVFGAFGA